MSDVFDQASETEERARQQALAAQAERAKAEPQLNAIGECHNPACGEPVAETKLFCNSECAKQYQRYKELK